MDISAAEFNARRLAGDPMVVVDVREELEFQTFNVGGDNVPLGTLLRDVADLDYEPEAEIIVICQRGLRSETACRAMSMAGFTAVRNLTGGLLALRKLTT